jgi:hypothetical protein
MSTEQTEKEIYDLVNSEPKYGGDAFLLLNALRVCHEPDDTFTLDFNKLAHQNWLPGWIRQRYENARRVLINTGYIKKISRNRGPISAQYQFGNAV